MLHPSQQGQGPSPACAARRRRRRGTFCLLSALVLTCAFGAGRARAASLSANVVPAASANLDLAMRAPADQALDLKIVFALRNQPALDQLLMDLQDPTSPRYHRWLTAQEFAQAFGPGPLEVLAVADWLRSEGFSLAANQDDPRYLRFAGSVAQAERAFGVRIFTSADRRLFGNADAPAIPERFAGLIGHIEGLDNLRGFVHSSAIEARQRAPESAAAAAFIAPMTIGAAPGAGALPGAPEATAPAFLYEGTALAFGPADLYTFYDESPLLSSGINGGGSDCIALVEDSDYPDTAVGLFDGTFSLAAANITRVFPTTNPGINGDRIEALLDIEYAHAIAPGAALRVYIGNGSNAKIDPIADGIKQAVTDNRCSAISISFQSCGASPSYFTGTLDPLFKQAASQGQSVFVSAGDSGAAGLVYSNGACVAGTTRNVNELSTDPNVTSVGGTQFTPNYDSSGNDQGSVPEQVWQTNGATGGGASTVFSKPAFQSGVTPADGRRDIPDLSMIANPGLPGVFLADDSSSPAIDCCFGGTSLSAPIVAGVARVIAESMGSRLGSINTRFYHLASTAPVASGIRDVTSGNNSYNGVTGYNAGPGYDLASGWGSVDISQLAAAFPVTPATPTPTRSPTPTPAPTFTPAPTATPTPGSIGPTGTPAPSGAPTPTPTPTTIGPSITIVSPSGITYGLKQAVTANYSCADAFGPITSCAGPVASGSAIDTSTVGQQSFTVNATDSNGYASSQSVNYTVTPLSTADLSFDPQFIHTVSAAQTVTLTNTQTDWLKVSGTAVSGDFRFQSHCRPYLAPGASCSITVRFAPKTAGAANGTFTVTAGSTAYSVALSGIGTEVRLSPQALNFPILWMGTFSPPRKVVLVNRQNQPLNISSIAVTGEFLENDTCGSQLAPLSRCSIWLLFAPRANASMDGTLTVTADAPIAPVSVPLKGFIYPLQ